MGSLSEFVDNILLGTSLVLFGIVGSCVKWLNVSKSNPTTVKVLIIETITAGFMGGIVYASYIWLKYPEGLAFIITGLAGWLGANSVELAIKYFSQRIGVDATEILNHQKKIDELSSKIVEMQTLLDKQQATKKKIKGKEAES